MSSAIDSPAARPGRLDIGIVGAGRVGTALGVALRTAGHRVVAASGVSRDSRERIERRLPEAAPLPPDEVVRRSALALLAVPDDALPDLVTGLLAAEAVRAGQLLAHTSGRYGLAVLEPVSAVGAAPLALHPVMTFTGSDVDVARLAGASFGVTAHDELRPVAEALVVEMGAEPVWIAEEARALYHAALAAGANHLVTLVAEAADLLRRAGVPASGRLLGPLLGAALDNALRSGDVALTGPVARGDADTVATHLRALAAERPESVPAYVAMARLTAERALAAGRLAPPAAEALLGVLATPPDGTRS